MFDIIVIGSGHAGIEAAQISNKLGLKTAMVSFSQDDIGYLACNVSIGGSAKGIVVKELFALGGLMPIAADETQLQTKVLNESKGPAVRALRAQIDKKDYPEWMKNKILNSSIKFIAGKVTSLLIKDKKVYGIILDNGERILSKKVILTTGTFLRSKTMKGKEVVNEGPDGKETTKGISEQLEDNDVSLIRLKTGTPPRIRTSSIDFSNLKIEFGNDEPTYFTEGLKISKKYENISAWLVNTNLNTHKIISDNFGKSYLYSDEMNGTGPRYCPSIEDKVKRFIEKPSHQVFLEIESKRMDTTYLTGLSSSLPKEVQEEFIRSIDGFKNCEFVKYAYAIEYDAINPQQLKQTLELKNLENLYCAGQINGTSGYEEAAAQGLIAGINAANSILGKEEFILSRNESYIGVMIDDITTKGIYDPYRLLSSRAEYRLLLRNDNATKRLYEKAFKNNLIDKKQFNYFKKRFDNQELFKLDLNKLKITPLEFKKAFSKTNSQLIEKTSFISSLIKRPELNLMSFKKEIESLIKKYSLLHEDLETINVELKFEGYILKQEREVQQYLKYQKYLIPSTFDYGILKNVANEAIEKLSKFKPRSIHQASNISGINPSDILILIRHLNQNDKRT